MKSSLSFCHLISILLAIYLAWAAAPPFPNVKSVAGYTHSDIRKKLGSPDTEFPDKFNRWEKKRGFFKWIFETDSPAPLNLTAPVREVAVRLIFVSPIASITLYTDEIRLREL